MTNAEADDINPTRSHSMRWTLVVALVLIGCRGAQHQEELARTARSAALDTAAIRRVCAQPDRVIVGRTTCELRDQGRIIKVF